MYVLVEQELVDLLSKDLSESEQERGSRVPPGRVRRPEPYEPQRKPGHEVIVDTRRGILSESKAVDTVRLQPDHEPEQGPARARP